MAAAAGRHRRAGRAGGRRQRGGACGQPALHALGRRSCCRWRARAWTLAQRLGARFMLPGNVYNFGERMPALLRRRHAAAPEHRQGPHPRASWRPRCARAPRSGLRSVVIRAGDFFGGGSGSWLDLVIAKSLAQRQAGLPRPAGRAACLGLPARPGARLRRRGRRATSCRPSPTLHFAGHTLDRRAAAGGAGARCRRAWASRRRSGWRHGGMPWALIRAGGAGACRCGASSPR